MIMLALAATLRRTRSIMLTTLAVADQGENRQSKRSMIGTMLVVTGQVCPGFFRGCATLTKQAADLLMMPVTAGRHAHDVYGGCANFTAKWTMMLMVLVLLGYMCQRNVTANRR